MDREQRAGGDGCGEIVAWIAAILISPAAALPGAMLVSWTAYGPGTFIDALFAAFTAFFTAPFSGFGLTAYGIAFFPCLFAGTTMMAFASVWPRSRSYAAWAAVGALLGALMGLLLAIVSTVFVWAGAGAGAACALIFRLIIGFAMPVVELANPRSPLPPVTP